MKYAPGSAAVALCESRVELRDNIDMRKRRRGRFQVKRSLEGCGDVQQLVFPQLLNLSDGRNRQPF